MKRWIAMALAAPLGMAIAPGVRAADLAVLDKADRVAVQATAAGQVTSIAQLSDVRPTDWAYQALQSLVERYGCIVGYPNKTYQGNRALSRYEFAAGLNACIDKVTEYAASKEDLETLKRLMQEFQTELASLRGRVDALEAKVSELQAQQFSTTTKLSGEVNMLLDQAYNPAGTNTGVSFASKTTISFDTSFSGRDLLSISMTSDNINSPANRGAAVPGGAANGGYPFLPAGTLYIDALNGPGTQVTTDFALDGLTYTVPVGDLTFVVGASNTQVENVLSTDGTFYDAQIGYLFTSGGPNIYLDPDAGAVSTVGFNWQMTPNWNFGAVYAAQSGAVNGGVDSTIGNGGFFSAGLQATTQLAYKSNDGKVIAALAYAYRNGPSNQDNQNFGGVNYGTFRAFTGPTNDADALVGSNNIALSFGWAIAPQFVLSAAYGLSFLAADGNTSTVQVWTVGMQFPNLFATGNEFGLAFGQAPYVTASSLPNGTDSGNFAFETYYKFQLTDSISITPALYLVTNVTGGAPNPVDGQIVTGNLVVPMLKTTFVF